MIDKYQHKDKYLAAKLKRVNVHTKSFPRNGIVTHMDNM